MRNCAGSIGIGKTRWEPGGSGAPQAATLPPWSVDVRRGAVRASSESWVSERIEKQRTRPLQWTRREAERAGEGSTIALASSRAPPGRGAIVGSCGVGGSRGDTVVGRAAPGGTERYVSAAARSGR